MQSTIEELSKLVSQTNAIIVTVSANDQFKYLSPEVQADVLWLMRDNLSRMKQVLDSANDA